jgi:hypothetical protein
MRGCIIRYFLGLSDLELLEAHERPRDAFVLPGAGNRLVW